MLSIYNTQLMEQESRKQALKVGGAGSVRLDSRGKFVYQI